MFCFLAFQMYILSCLNPCCLYKQKHVLLPSTFSPQMRTQLSLHGDSLHSAERIKSVSSSQIGKEFGKGCSLSQSCCMAFWALCTLCCMISYLLLLNEHKETSDFGLGCPYHSYSIFIPHIPVGVFLLFVWVFLSPPNLSFFSPPCGS